MRSRRNRSGTPNSTPSHSTSMRMRRRRHEDPPRTTCRRTAARTHGLRQPGRPGTGDDTRRAVHSGRGGRSVCGVLRSRGHPDRLRTDRRAGAPADDRNRLVPAVARLVHRVLVGCALPARRSGTVHRDVGLHLPDEHHDRPLDELRGGRHRQRHRLEGHPAGCSAGPRRLRLLRAWWCQQVRMILTGTAGRGWRAMSWPFRRTYRLLGLSWLVAFFFVGQAQLSLADDGLIVAPDLAHGTAQTPFEQIPLSAYKLPINLSAANYGGPLDIQAGVWGVMNGIETGIVYVSLSLVKGAITCLQWLLNLTIYRDNASQIDSAVQGVAEHIYWPLLGVTLAIAGVTMYGRMRREGRGSIFSDLVWVLAATVLGMTFVLAPSKVAGDMDDIRTLAADGAMTGYSSYAPAGQSAAGFPDVPVTNDSAGASRSLANSMWNTYAVTVWCLDAFNSLDVCKDIGHDYLTQDARWKSINDVNNKTGQASNDSNVPSTCADELKGNCDWYRGQSL